MPSVVEQLPDDPAELKALLLPERSESQSKDKTISQLRQHVHALLESLRLEKHRLYGSRSEKSSDQTELFDESEFDQESSDVQEEESQLQPAVKTSPRKRPSRKPLPKDLPRVRQVHELSAEQRQCPCGCEMQEIGEEISEQLDIIPAQVQVIQHVRKKYACKDCEESIEMAPRPAVLLLKAIASGGTMAYISTSKCADGLRLYRMSDILKRYGIDIPRQTLSESVLKTAQQIEPLFDYLLGQLKISQVLHMDETRVQMLREPGKSSKSQSYMWVQRGGPPDKPMVHFTYEPSRAASVPERLLEDFSGVLMSDGYTAYRRVAAIKQLIHLCCWAHARRKFVDAQKAQPKGKTGKAEMAISFIAKLYGIEKQHRQSDTATRHCARQAQALPGLTQFHAWLLKTQQQVIPKSAMGKAVNYALEYWPELTRYTEAGHYPIDNNVAENAIRPFMVGRKAWLFSNSQRGARGSANSYSLIETAKANHQEPYSYLRWLFDKLPTADLTNCKSLMPWNMPMVIEG